MFHTPVLVQEILQIFNIIEAKKYLDCTFGAGGHSRAILESDLDANVVALDIDPNVIWFANEVEKIFAPRFSFINENFKNIDQIFSNQSFDAVILDLGVSSMQIDSKDRGFSFNKDSFLDMRMGESALRAFDVINNFSKVELENIFYELGDEVQSRHIAQAIVDYRRHTPINTTIELANIVRGAMHYKGRIDPATRTFQAIRIYINKELDNLSCFLSKLNNILAVEGVVIIISFHSLEDRIVKNFFRSHNNMVKQNPNDYDIFWKLITKKPISPSREEVRSNIRSRSAKLRAAQKILYNI